MLKSETDKKKSCQKYVFLCVFQFLSKSHQHSFVITYHRNVKQYKNVFFFCWKSRISLGRLRGPLIFFWRDPPNFQGGIFCLKTCPLIFLWSRRHLGFAWRHSTLFVRFALGLPGLRVPDGGEKISHLRLRDAISHHFWDVIAITLRASWGTPPSGNPPFRRVWGPLAHLVSR